MDGADLATLHDVGDTTPAGAGGGGGGDFDVLIVGAGLSGVDAAYRIQTMCPGKRYAILEARHAIGGTWDLFRYPGIRSDSDMHTLGFPFNPWRGEKAIADGSDIRDYVRDTAAKYGIDRQIRFDHKVKRASWSTPDARWTLEVETDGGRTQTFTCNFLFSCSGYYDYEGGYTPDFPGISDFAGKIVHPQFWPEDLEVEGRKVVVIGSGATAVTLAPSLAARGAEVTMLQRSPTYIVSRRARDTVADFAHRFLPGRAADGVVRWKNIMYTIVTYALAKKRPDRVKSVIIGGVRRQLGKDYDVKRHFTPSYNPWDQRICLVPDGDLFRSIREGRMKIVTDRIANITAKGVSLESGDSLPADIIVTATGLVVKMAGGVAVEVDGKPVSFADHMFYKGMMLSDVPNFAVGLGYTNASWTLKIDLTSRYVCRLINHMDRTGTSICTPRVSAKGGKTEPVLDFSSGYVQRALALLPRQGERAPWRVHQNYLKDMLALKLGKVKDGTMEFSGAKQTARRKAA